MNEEKISTEAVEKARTTDRKDSFEKKVKRLKEAGVTFYRIDVPDKFVGKVSLSVDWLYRKYGKNIIYGNAISMYALEDQVDEKILQLEYSSDTYSPPELVDDSISEYIDIIEKGEK